MKTYEMKVIAVDCVMYCYFYKREKNDINGNPRFRVWLIDPEGCAVYEKVFYCYEFQIAELIERVINDMQEEEGAE